MKYLVTGGGGFLGKGIVKKLLGNGHEVRSFSRGSYPELSKLGVQTFTGDISNKNDLRKSIEGCDGVFHVAAKAGVWGSYEDYYKANVVGTENVVELCKEYKVPNLVYTSSPSVVFDGTDQEGLSEKTPFPKKFLAHYPRTKAQAEKHILESNSDQLATIALRPHLIWGPGDNHLVPRVLKKGKARQLKFIGREDKLVDSIYIDNAVDAHIIAMRKLETEKIVNGKSYFVTNQEPVPLSHLINGILKAGNIPAINKRIPTIVAYGIGGVFESIYKIAKIKKEPPITRFVAKQLSTAHWYNSDASINELGYSASISIQDGLSRLEKHLMENT